MRIAAYARVSTVRQALEGCSLEAQESRLRTYANANGHELVALEVDHGISGKSLDRRDALARALALIKAGMADALVVTALSRLSRSSRDLQNLLHEHFRPAGKSKRHEARLISLSEGFDSSTPAGRMMITMLGAVAAMERELTAERCSEAAAFNKARGLLVGSPSYGWRALGAKGSKNRRLEPVPHEQELVAIARRRRLVDGWTLQAICDELSALGFRTRANTRFQPNQVTRLCTGAAPVPVELAA